MIGLKPRQLQFVQSLVQRRRNRVVGEFHEQIVFLVERVAGRVVPNILKIFEAEMEVAAGGEDQASFKRRLNFIPALLYQFGNEIVILARVRRPDDVSDAIGDGHFSHRARDFERFCAVIEARKYVAMNINHQSARITQGRRDDNPEVETANRKEGEPAADWQRSCTYRCETE